MTKKGFPILFILLIIIAPITSAFDHCSGMSMADHLSTNQNLNFNNLVVKPDLQKHMKMASAKQNHQTDSHCHMSNGCTFHVCSAYGMIFTNSIFNTISSSDYSAFEYFSLYNTTSSLDIRPPISL